MKTALEADFSTTNHTTGNFLQGIKVVTITHPYHPHKDKTFEYLWQAKYEPR